MTLLLRTERLTLRPLRESDVDKLIELDSDPEVMRFISEGIATPPEVIRDDVLPRMLGYDARAPE
jgi:RimJ/RimL family protein N-acetyltransferase